MKIFKILSHPYTLIVCFLFILISGRHLGGFYALYILLGLPHGAIHSLLGFLGIVVLLVSYHLIRKQSRGLQMMVNLLGISLMFLSLFYFFKNDTERYNWGTFNESLPVFTIVLASLIGLCFLLANLRNPPRSGSETKQNFLSRV